MTALITGASSGIGLAFAEQLAEEGHDLVLVARRRDRLEAAAIQLHDRHGVTATVLPADLSEDGVWDEIGDHLTIRGIDIDVLVNNAGFGVHEDVAASTAADLVKEVQVNCTALVGLTTRLLPGMVERASGSIVNIGSTASFQPVPHMAVYGASKAFVLSFSEALAVELAGTGVRVLALCPGATDTEFFAVAGEAARTGRSRSAVDLVRHGLKALQGGRSSTVHGIENALVANVATRLLPRRTMAAMAGRATGRPTHRP